MEKEEDFLELVSKSRKRIENDINDIHAAVMKASHDIFRESSEYPFMRKENDEIMKVLQNCLNELDKLNKAN